MDYEQKLKEAINSEQTDYEVVRWIKHSFPELAESEDEKIRKAIVSFIDEMKGDFGTFGDIKLDDMVAWLEKQSEQKPAWSEEDEFKINRIVACLENLNVADNGILLKDINWLKDLKDRVQPKQEWSEEDEKMLRDIIDDFSDELDEWTDKEEIEIITNKISFLNSLKPQPIHVWSREDNRTRLEITNYLECQKREEPTRTDILNKWIAWIANLDPQGKQGSQWKPSEEMLEALYKVIPENVMAISDDEMLLDKLYQGLKYGRVLSKN